MMHIDRLATKVSLLAMTAFLVACGSSAGGGGNKGPSFGSGSSEESNWALGEVAGGAEDAPVAQEETAPAAEIAETPETVADAGTIHDTGSTPTDTGSTPSDVKPGPDVPKPAGSARLVGTVLGEDDAPVKGATVRWIENKLQTVTDGAGRFAFEDQAGAMKVHVRIEMTGYASVDRVLAVPEAETTVLRARLLAKGKVRTINGKFGGVAHVPRGSVQFKQASFVDAAGKPWADDVLVTITHLDPSTQQIEAAPGNFQALDSTGSLVLLESYAMADVLLATPDGKQLQLAPGTKAVVDMDLPIDTKFKLGEVVPLWAYDVDKGLWIEEGLGTVKLSTRDPKRLAFLGEVTHFTTWNCDAGVMPGCMTGKVIGCDEAPLQGVAVDVKVPNQGGVGTADYDTSHTDGKYGVNTRIGVPATLTYHVGERIAKTLTYTPTSGGFCNPGMPVNMPEIKVCFDGCVTGTVTDDDGAPVAGVKVAIPENISGEKGGTAAYTTDDGSFKALALSTQPTDLTFEKKGYFGAKLNTTPVVGDLKAQTCNTDKPLQIQLARPCVSGLVTDLNGQPMPNAEIVFESLGNATTKAVSAPDGTYVLKTPKDATGTLIANAKGYWSVKKALTITASEACAANTAQPAPKIMLPPRGCLTGKVLDETGNGVEGVTVAGGAGSATSIATTGKGGGFCLEGPVGTKMVIGASGKGLAGEVQTVAIQNFGVCGDAACGTTNVDLKVEPTVFDHFVGGWKDCQQLLGDVALGDLQVTGSGAGLTKVKGMHAVALQDPDGTRRIAIVLSDADGPSVVQNAHSLWIAEMAIGPYNDAQVVTYNHPFDSPTEPNAATKFRGQIISKTMGYLGVDTSYFRLSDVETSTMTVVYAPGDPDKIGEGFFDLRFETVCGVGTGTVRVKGSFVIKSQLKLPIVANGKDPQYLAYDNCYQKFDQASLWNPLGVGHIKEVSIAGQPIVDDAAISTSLYSHENKGLYGGSVIPTEGLSLSYNGGGATLTGEFATLALGKNTVGLKSFCGDLGFLGCCAGTPQAPVSLACPGTTVLSTPGGCDSPGTPACPAQIGGTHMSLETATCTYDLLPEQATIDLVSSGASPFEGTLSGTLAANFAKGTLKVGAQGTCPAATLSATFDAAACSVSSLGLVGYAHASDPMPAP